MKIGDPTELFGQLGQEEMEVFKERFGDINRLLKPGDTFRYECDKGGQCCKNRFGNPIALSTYDIARLRGRLKIVSGAFLEEYAYMVLGEDSHLPIVFLKFKEEGNGRNKCPFLRSYGCMVYDDRPLRCRLYPLGRAVDLKGVSYFFLMETADYCGAGKGKTYTLEEWLKVSEVELFLKWSDRFFKLFFRMDLSRFKDLDQSLKLKAAVIMYDIDRLMKESESSLNPGKKYSDEEILSLAHIVLKSFFRSVLTK